MFSKDTDLIIYFFNVCLKYIFYRKLLFCEDSFRTKISSWLYFSRDTFKATQTLTQEISGNGLYSQKLPFTKNKTIRNKHQNLHLI